MAARRPLKGILSAIGDTPLVEMGCLIPGFDFRLFAKMERFNPGGSVKDRSALAMLQAKILDGGVRPGRTVVIESSSGNLAIGLALLPPRERRIIEARFLEKKTLAQVGVELRLTRERVRQLQKQALRFLRAWLGAPETTGV